MTQDPRNLLITVNLLDTRYHGSGSWPPSPFRLFQALVAAAHQGRQPEDAEVKALHWLGSVNAQPTIVRQRAYQSRAVTYYVPRNAWDQVKGDREKAAKLRDAKIFHPWFFEHAEPLLYIWRCADVKSHFKAIEAISNRVYQLGRGIDMAYATAELLTDARVQSRVDQHSGAAMKPSAKGDGVTLGCPTGASMDSLIQRHSAQLGRLVNGTLRQAPKPAFQSIPYDSQPSRLLFDILKVDGSDQFHPLRYEHAARIVEQIRDWIIRLLTPHHAAHLLEKFVLGRGANEYDKRRRIRIISLPSIGAAHADHQIRRVLVEIPADCPVPGDDIKWALSGIDLSVDLATGEIGGHQGAILTPSHERKMLRHYGIGGNDNLVATQWRTITPIALSNICSSRSEQSGRNKISNLQRQGLALRQALRHVGINQKLDTVRLQKEPFEATGLRAEWFSHGDRFPGNQLFHAEITFSTALTGPMVLGNGRYIGLGLMAPIPRPTP
jgi:CRISPR-associated protein Csb2